MNQEETIAFLKGMQNKKVDYAEMVCAPAFCSGYEYVYPEPEDYAIEEAISALKEVQQYRAIGTVEECRKAVNSTHESYKPERYYDTEPEYNPCEGCQIEGTNDEDFYWPGQGPCDHCSKRR